MVVNDMQADDIMTRPALTFRPDTPVLNAAAVLRQKQVRAAPVVDSSGRLIGLVATEDLVVPRIPTTRPRNPASAAQTVGQVMRTTVIAMSPSSPVACVARALVDYDLPVVPIVVGMGVVGVVSRGDLVRSLVPTDDVIRDEVAGRLRSYTGDGSECDVAVRDGEVRIHTDLDDQAHARVLIGLAGGVPGVTHVAVYAARRSTRAAPSGRRVISRIH
jgi:CBS domain-containing protein